MQTLEFTPLDVGANRQGVLSASQQQRLAIEAKALHGCGQRIILAFAVFFGAAILVAAVSAYNINGQNLNQLFSEASLTRCAPMIFCLTGLLFWMVVLEWWSTASYANTHQPIQSIEGTARVVNGLMHNDRYMQTYRLELRYDHGGTETFHFRNADSLQYFKEGRRYRVYYRPVKIPQLLSAEELP
jgi:hypothetical protein